jgi:polysaccharide pyruvyl transferase WcaK-like protein
MEELIGHFNEYDLVLSSRFHALLTAAWFRCRVIALSLSSKISQLAEELDVEMIEPDFDNALFEKKVHSSRVVDIERLNKILKRLMDVSVTC